MTCSKLAMLNKAILGAFFKSQKSKNRLKSYVKITDSYLLEIKIRLKSYVEITNSYLFQIKGSITLF